MSKRVSKGEVQFLIWALIIGLPIYGIGQLGELLGWGIFVAGALVLIALFLWFQKTRTKKRHEGLMAKYQDAQVVEKIMEQTFWQGQTSAQLLDSLGDPEDVDEKILKTKKREVWKYKHQSANRYGLRITLDNDVVVGWEQKT